MQRYTALARDMPVPTGDAVARAAQIMAWLRTHRLVSLLAPRVQGGEGGGLAEAVQVVFDVASRSGSAGLTYAMHLSQVWSLVGHGAGSPYLMGVLAEVSEAQGLIASVASELRSHGNIHLSHNRIVPDEAGGRLSKDTTNTSYAPEASAFLATALDGEGARPVQRLVLVRAADTVMRERHRNHLLGMNGIDNRSWSFDFRFPMQAVLDEPFPAIASRTMTPATHILWAAVWSGIAASALGKARQVVKQMGTDGAHAGQTLSELRNRHFLINTLIRDALAESTAHDGRVVSLGGSARINRLKITASDLACEVVLGALKLCGLRGYAEGGSLSVAEEVRDVLSGPLMVSNARLQSNTLKIDRYSEERP